MWQTSNANPFSQQLHFCNKWWSIQMAWFSRPFCSTLSAQTSMMCLLMLCHIEVLLIYSTNNIKLTIIFNSSIPGIVVIKDNILYALELTVCFEADVAKSWNYKINRYKNLSNEVVRNYDVKKLFMEILLLWFYTKDTKSFSKFLR